MNNAADAGNGGAQSDHDPQRTAAVDGNAVPPEQPEIPRDYISDSKQFLIKWICAPFGALVRWIDVHDGLVTALATVVLAVLTCFVALYANGQLKVFGSQLEEMKSTGTQTTEITNLYKRLADESVKQSEASANQLAVMRNQLQEMQNQSAVTKSQMRANFRLILDRITDRDGWRVTPGLYNTGETEALSFRGWDDSDFFNALPEDNFDFTRPRKNWIFPSGISVARGDRRLLTTVFISKEQAGKILRGEGYFIVWGRVDYRDVFEADRHYYFCNIVAPKMVDGNSIDISFPFYRNECNSSQ